MTEEADLLHRYARAIDAGAYDDLRDVFTPDATADLGTLGGVREGIDAITAYIRRALSRYDAVQHFISNVSVAGDASSCYFLAYHLRAGEPPFIVGGEYHDRFVRTDGGPRIAHRTLIARWQR